MARRGDAPARRQPKRCFAVTARGRRALRDGRAVLERLSDGIEPLIGN